MMYRLYSDNHHYQASVFGTLVMAVFFTFPSHTIAQEEFFLPDALRQSAHSPHQNLSNLNNIQLIERANDLRSQELNATQRTLNYQWLENHQNPSVVLGRKAYQAFFKRGLKEFWHRQRKERFKSKYVPDINGRGAVSGELDYNVRFSSDELKLGLTYEF